MNDEKLLKERMFELLDNVEEGTPTEKVVVEMVKLFNDHSKNTSILSWREKDRIKRMEKMIEFKKGKVAERDEAKEAQKREDLGERYNDYLNGEISALEWAVKFAKEHSV